MCHQKPFSVSESEDVGAIVGNSGQLQSGPCQQISAQACEKFLINQQREYYQPLYDDNSHHHFNQFNLCAETRQT